MTTKYSEREIKHMFYSYDTDGNGYLDFDEFCELMKSSGSIDKSNYQFIFNLVDTDRNGKIKFKEFKRVAQVLCNFFLKDNEKSKKKSQKEEDVEQSTFLFKLVDLDNSKTIDKNEFDLLISASKRNC